MEWDGMGCGREKDERTAARSRVLLKIDGVLFLVVFFEWDLDYQDLHNCNRIFSLSPSHW